MANSVPANRPTLHEIAAMPFPRSVEAMRSHYDPSWGTTPPEGKRRFKVTVEYSVTSQGDFVTEVEAASKNEAREAAIDEARDEACGENFEVIDVSVRSIVDMAEGGTAEPAHLGFNA